MTRVFIHGLESSSRGTKGVFFRERYPDMIIEDYGGPLEERMVKLDRLLAGRQDLLLVGSSFGGLMAAIYACENEARVRKVVLLAPALHVPDFSRFLCRRVKVPVLLFHGKHDDVVPPSEVKTIAETVFENLDYRLVDDDHSLHATFPLMDWVAILGPGRGEAP
ncbi:MAG: alpha/beta fold hydrolase [Syntrophaceae bacterium]|nr:alpha/beta fold hydrolase [Syntrophaceae bacterium]